MLNHPAFSMQQCKCLDVHYSGERTLSGPQRAQQEAVPTGPMKGATGGKIKEFCLAGSELYDRRKGNLPLYKLTNCWSHCAVRPFRGMPPLVSLYTGKWPFLLSYSSIPARQNSFILPPVAPFVGPVGIASCCSLWGPDGVLSSLQWMSKHLHCCMENAGWSSTRFVPFLSMLIMVISSCSTCVACI